MTINRNKDRKQNPWGWKYLQPDEIRLVNKEDNQKIYNDWKHSWLNDTINSVVNSEKN